MNPTRALVIALLPAVYVHVFGAEQAADNQAVDHAEKLRVLAVAERPWAGIHRWLFEYEGRSLLTNRSIPARKVMAAAAPGELYQFLAHFPGDIPWQVDPYAQEFFIHEGRTCLRRPFNRAYAESTLKPGAPIPGSTSEDVLLPVLPRWPVTDYKMPVDPRSKAPVILIQALHSPEHRLLEGSERLNAETCAVFDYKGIDRIWIATNKGLCLMQYERKDPTSHRLLDRIITDKVELVAPGLWFPTDFRLQFFEGRGTKEPTLEREIRIRIIRYAFNDDVPPSTFVPVHKPGAIKYDERERSTQVNAGGEDLLEEIINFMTQHAKLPTKKTLLQRPYVWTTVGIISGLLAAVFLTRSSGRAKGPGGPDSEEPERNAWKEQKAPPQNARNTARELAG